MALPTVPKGYHSLTPFLVVGDVEAAVRFYAEAFGAATKTRREDKGRLLLADLMIGDSHLVLSDRSTGDEPLVAGNRTTLRLYVADVTATFDRALGLGAKEIAPLSETYWGERVGELTDPFGFRWKVSEYLEEVPHREIERRMHEALG